MFDKNKYDNEKNLYKFNDYINNDEGFKYYKELYTKFYDYYKVKDEEFMKIEKIRLQAKVGKYNTDMKNFIISIGVMIIGFILNATITILVNKNNDNYIYAFAIAAYVIILVILPRNAKKEDNTVFNIGLQVIDDIEQERKSKVKESIDKELFNKIKTIIYPKGIEIEEYHTKRIRKFGYHRRLFKR